jgi:hypothetical protein
LTAAVALAGEATYQVRTAATAWVLPTADGAAAAGAGVAASAAACAATARDLSPCKRYTVLQSEVPQLYQALE